MAQEYDNNMRGVLFRNDKKTSEAHPDYKGQGEIDHKEIWVSAWIKTSRAGKKYMSLSFEYKDQQGQGQAQRGSADVPIDNSGFANATTPPAVDDDIPF